MTKQRWIPIPGCSNYAIGSHGQVKRLKHRANGKRHKIMKEQLVKLVYYPSRKPYARIIGDNGRQRELSVEKIFIAQFLKPNTIYYKTIKSNEIHRIDCYIESEVYDKMREKPQIFKTIKT